MKLTNKQKNAIFKAFAERLACEQYSNCELTDAELGNWYWAEVEAALEK